MWKKVVLSILLVISDATGFFAAKAQVTIEGRLNKVNRDYDTDLSSVDLSNIHVETDSKVINILLLGDDYRTYDGSTSPGLNVVILSGTLDMKHNTLKLTSIMRDTLVDVYGQNKKMKVNAAGKIILSVAVLAIIITAPIGAIGIDCSYKTLLEKN